MRPGRREDGRVVEIGDQRAQAGILCIDDVEGLHQVSARVEGHLSAQVVELDSLAHVRAARSGQYIQYERLAVDFIRRVELAKAFQLQRKVLQPVLEDV